MNGSCFLGVQRRFHSRAGSGWSSARCLVRRNILYPRLRLKFDANPIRPLLHVEGRIADKYGHHPHHVGTRRGAVLIHFDLFE